MWAGEWREKDKIWRAFSKPNLDIYTTLAWEEKHSENDFNGGGKLTFSGVLSNPDQVELLHSSFLLLLFPFLSFPAVSPSGSKGTVKRQAQLSDAISDCSTKLEDWKIVWEKYIFVIFFHFFPLYTSLTKKMV